MAARAFTPRKDRQGVGAPAQVCPPGARRRRRCILEALRCIELCIWEHLYIGGSPAATLKLLAAVEWRAQRLRVELEGDRYPRAPAVRKE